ncbi:MAG: hypothetical protein LAT63_03750 [Marinobacter sp.]|nr:hypothetical protein [Marinobacter sp.]
MDRWTSYLFQSHSEETLRNWARRLSLFRVFRAYGGHANDGDSLDVVFRYDNIEQLQAFLTSLGISLVRFDAAPPQPEPGVSYPGDVFMRFPSLIPGTRWLQQPGHSVVWGHKVFIWCNGETVRLSIHDGYYVTEACVAAAEVLETALAHCDLERIDPPVNTKNCICPQHYPEYFD